MGRQKYKKQATNPLRHDKENSSSSDSDPDSSSESDVAGPTKRVVEEPRKKSTVAKTPLQGSSSETTDADGSDPQSDDDSSCDSESSDDAEPTRIVAKVAAKTSTLKRSRCDDDTVDARPSKRATNEAEKPIHHESYQGSRNNGAWTLVAGKTYFKIPTSILTRPSKYFREEMDRFQRETGQKGPQDILLKMQESPEDVAALQWLLTAYPNEIVEQGDPSKADLPRLVSVLYMTNKYHFPEHEAWAKSQLRHCLDFRADSSELKNPKSLSIENYKRLYTLASSIWPQFTCCIRTKWLSAHAFRFKEILDFAESTDDRSLQGDLYYAKLLHLKVARQDASLAALFPENKFTATQNMRLYRGFWSLSQFWADVRIPELKEGTSKDHRDSCTKDWTWMWEMGAGIKPFGDSGQPTIFHPLEALDRLINLPPSPSTSGDAEPGRCGCRFQTAAKILMKSLRRDLADHFLGVIDNPPTNTIMAR
ncbi:hypothetical protein M413DRAFT_419828 [Hebeloma cylindrosporum]|uniref:BTB domain-containing protein n=1 Tax=Hebeloma cylindrosporum TaxID=76867 RepID=A0A0C2XMA3_HEBCY|nr:hypothetical protein M413DRAFT_419828 [Hebeloma cylindrosporum h7]